MTDVQQAVPVAGEDRIEACKHKFVGWREFDDGLGGECVCEHCGLGAMAWTLGLDI